MKQARQKGRFWKAREGYLVVTDKRPARGDEVMVHRKSTDTICTVVVTGKPMSLPGGRWASPFADIGSNAAEKARVGLGDRLLVQGRNTAKMKRDKQRAEAMRVAAMSAHEPVTRPRGCVGGMTEQQARREARSRGPDWASYQCEKCQEWHLEES